MKLNSICLGGSLFVLMMIAGCSQLEEADTLHQEPASPKGAYSPSSAVIDDFNDGIIDDIWEVGVSEGATVYEADGALHIIIDEGATSQGWNQVGGLTTKGYIIRGDFDLQLDFQLCEDYHQIEEGNTLLMLIDGTGEGLEISIRTNRYESKESNIIHAHTYTDHLAGKLRIARTRNKVTTYYWENGWVMHAQWEPTVVVAEDLKITFFSWNWDPGYSALETQLDNLIMNKGFIKICHQPDTDNQKTLVLPPAAIDAFLSQGDYIGTCECWEIYPVTGHQYMLTDYMSWPEANAIAEQMGGYLVTLYTGAEEAWLKETFGDSELFWIGYTDMEQEGVWVWTSGINSTYTNWAPGEPNNYNNEDVAVMNALEGNNYWNDVPMDGYLRGIIERN
jgi:hypothetical protein